jgi:gentisate 1,2-dioxygenase
MEAKLRSGSDDWTRSEYRTASDTYISRTIGAHAERIKGGKTGSPPKDTCSYVYHIRSGDGQTFIELSSGSTEMLHWTKGDTFAVPAWSKITHSAADGKDAYLFVLSDKPVLESLNMYIVE